MVIKDRKTSEKQTVASSKSVKEQATTKKPTISKSKPAKIPTTTKSTSEKKKVTSISNTTESVAKKKIETTKLPVKKQSKELALYLSYDGNGHRFEKDCETYLHRYHEKYGKVKINPKKTGDGGCDLFSDVLDDFNDVKKRYYFQAKLRNPDGPVVGPEVLNALIGAIERLKLNEKEDDDDIKRIGVVITTGRFSDKTKAQARKMNMQLIDGIKLSKEPRFNT